MYRKWKHGSCCAIIDEDRSFRGSFKTKMTSVWFRRPTMDLKWEEGYTIRVRSEYGRAVISANREGLLSLASHFLTLAKEKPGSHIHLEHHNSLEEDSAELVIERIE